MKRFWMKGQQNKVYELKGLTRYRNKVLHGQFLKGTEEVRAGSDSWD